MKVDVERVNEKVNGWDVRFNVKLSSDELSRLDQSLIPQIEDFEIDQKGSVLYFNCYINTGEPWEDEPLEELIKALKHEIEYRTNSLLK